MKNKILAADYKKLFRHIIIGALILAVITGIAVPLSLRTQIREAAALEQSGGEGQESEAYEKEAEDQITPLSPFNYVLFGLCGAMWAAALLYYWLCVIAWLYKSALAAGMNRSLWPILGGFFNILAVLAFLIVRDRPSKQTA